MVIYRIFTRLIFYETYKEILIDILHTAFSIDGGKRYR